MSRQELREQLARLAEDAPVASVPDDTYRRGRRATTLARLGVGAVAAACLVLAGTSVGQLKQHATTRLDATSQPDTSNAPPGIPDHIWAYTFRAAPRAERQTPFLSAVAAYTVPDLVNDPLRSDLVLVTADGQYARMGFPDHDLGGRSFAGDDPIVALSPDGSKVAWYYMTHQPVRTGIAVMDLHNGTVKSVGLGGRTGLQMRRITWSPNGQALLWYGETYADGQTTTNRPVGGVLLTGPATLRRAPVQVHGRWAAQQICDDGTLNDSEMLVERAGCGPDMRPLRRDGQVSRPLGRIGRDLVTLEHPVGSSEVGEVMVDGTTISRIDSAGIDNLTIATGLITAGQPSHHVDAPDWARSQWRWRVVGIGSVAALLVGAGLLWRRRRLTHR